MELVTCHGEISLNNTRNVLIANEIINIDTIIVPKVNFGLTRNSLHLINAMINSNAKTVIS